MAANGTAVRKERDGTFSAHGVWLGSSVGASLFAEPIETGRYLIRKVDANGVRRLGEVAGSGRRFTVYRERELVGIERSLTGAVNQLSSLSQ